MEINKREIIMNEQSVREFLTAINIKEDWDIDDESLGETLVDHGRKVYSGEQDSHRWYIREIGSVQQIEGRFIQYDDYIITGDNSMSDMDLHYDIDNAKFVEKKTRTIEETIL